MVSNIIEEVKKGLTGDPLKDIQYLQEQAAKYKDSPDSAEILKILSDMSFELLRIVVGGENHIAGVDGGEDLRDGVLLFLI